MSMEVDINVDKSVEASITESVERLRIELRAKQARLETELNESLRASGWVRGSVSMSVRHLTTMDDYKWAKVSLVDVGCWRSPTGRVFLTRMDQYQLEQAETEIKNKELYAQSSVLGILGDEND